MTVFISDFLFYADNSVDSILPAGEGLHFSALRKFSSKRTVWLREKMTFLGNLDKNSCKQWYLPLFLASGVSNRAQIIRGRAIGH